MHVVKAKKCFEKYLVCFLCGNQGRKCRDISSTFQVSGFPNTISTNENQTKEKSENIGDISVNNRYIGHSINYKCSVWNKT